MARRVQDYELELAEPDDIAVMQQNFRRKRFERPVFKHAAKVAFRVVEQRKLAFKYG